jgi:hypothetical protein
MYWAFLPGDRNGQAVKPAGHLRLLPRLRIGGNIIPAKLHVFKRRYNCTFTFSFNILSLDNSWKQGFYLKFVLLIVSSSRAAVLHTRPATAGTFCDKRGHSVAGLILINGSVVVYNLQWGNRPSETRQRQCRIMPTG